jgi:hypothetical protein
MKFYVTYAYSKFVRSSGTLCSGTNSIFFTTAHGSQLPTQEDVLLMREQCALECSTLPSSRQQALTFSAEEIHIVSWALLSE